MHKVVIERPRWNPGPGKKGRAANLPDELMPKFEGIRRPYSCRKAFTDLLGPLRRWLQSQIGRPWDDVYSEACKVIKADSVIRAHVKTHLLEFVERGTFMHDGKVCVLDTGRNGGVKPIMGARYRWHRFYVHPETGILKRMPEIPRRTRKAQSPKQPFTMRWIRKNVSVQQIRGLWFECHFEVVPLHVKFKAYDYLLERTLSRSEISRHENSYYLCVRKRQLSKRELREHGLHNAPETDSIGARFSRRCGSVLKTALRKISFHQTKPIKTMTQSEKASRFHDLHQRAGLFLIPNPWDAGSVRVLAGLGFEALATSSAAAAAVIGKRDGKLSREESLANARSIVDATDLPVSADLENGFGDDPKMTAETILLAAKAGLVGGSIEDATGKPDNSLYEISFAAERVAAAVQAARSLPFHFTLTGRAENFIRGKPDLADTIKRLVAYEKAGADVLFAPGLPDLAAVREVCSAVTKPVNVIAGIRGKSFSMEELAGAGVKRVSFGSSLYRAAMTGLINAASEAKARGTCGYSETTVTTADFNRFLPG